MKRPLLFLLAAGAAARVISLSAAELPAWPTESRAVASPSALDSPSWPVAAATAARLETFRAAQQQALQTGSFAPVADFLHEHVRVLPEYHPTLPSRAAAARYHEAFAARFAVERHERRSEGAHDLGGRVLEYGTFRQTLVQRSNSERHELAGSYLDLWESGDGQPSQIVTTVWNYDRHPPIERDLRFPDVPGVRMALEAHVPVTDDISFELAALNQLLETVVSEHDGNTWVRFYAEDATLMPNHHPLLRGRTEIETYLTRHAQDRPVFEELDIRNDRIDALGAHVIEYATHVANWRHGTSSGVNTGKNVRIWRRGADGSLRIVWQIGTYD